MDDINYSSGDEDEDGIEDEEGEVDDEEEGTSDEEVVEDEEEEEEENEGSELAAISKKSGPSNEPEPTSSSSVRTFSELGISSWLVAQLKQLQIARPTPVQAACIPQVLSGRDVLGCAKTGTGKTLAFALPIVQQLSVDPWGIFALILTPTRELAVQIGEQFAALGKPIGLKVTVVVGGHIQTHQSIELSRRPHVVVATPGRLADMMGSDERGAGTELSRIKYLVLDEADQLLNGQYAEQLTAIFGGLPKERQTLLFSATITSAIEKLNEVSVRKPFYFEDVSAEDETAQKTVERLEQQYVLCPVDVKDAYLVYVIKNYVEKNEHSSVLVFTHTCREAQALSMMFSQLGFRVGALHSQIRQFERTASLAQFRSKRLRVLIATDVASRGLDIPHVDLVVNHNVPQCSKTYVHRVGRSARAGRFGAALTFVTPHDIVLLKAVEKAVGKKLDELKVNDKQVSKYVTQVLVTKREAELTLEQQNFGERKERQQRNDMLRAGMDKAEVEKILEQRRLRQKGQLYGSTREGRKTTKRKPDQEEGPKATKQRKKKKSVEA